jgi:hypothetical protein
MIGWSIAAAAMLQQLASAPTQPQSSVSPADSMRIVRSVRSAQSSFETFRRLRLPIGERHYGECDVHIGRYCYWRGDDEDDDPAPPEAAAIRARRGELVRLLDSASQQLPGDSWIAGQRVRYLVEAGERERARDAAERDCAAEAGWCRALAGFAAHSFGDYPAADSAYRDALTAMSEPERCRWLDISDVLDAELGKRYERLDCPAREILARRAAVMGAPLFLVGASDLLTEHLARFTRARIAERAATPDGESWADDARELVMRYGWPSWYSRTDPSPGSLQRPGITGHDSGRPYYFFPSLRAIEHPGETHIGDWRLDDPRAPMGYAPAFARLMHDLPHQIARFRHGDSMFVVAAWDASRDTSLANRELEVALALTDDARPQAPIVTRRRDTGGLLRSIVADSGMASIELLDRTAKHAARARVGFSVAPARRVWLSDLLIFRPWTSDAKHSLDSTLTEHAIRSDVVRRSDTLSVFWEAYGLRHEPVRFTLSVEQIGVSWMRRTAEAFRLADRTTGVRVQWEEVPLVENGIAARDVRVDLSRLRTGRYRVQLTVVAAGEPPATSTRQIEVR